MRLAIFVCGFALVAGPVSAQTRLPAPSPQSMMQRGTPQAKATTKAAAQVQAQANAQLNRQVSAVQQRLQQEEARLQGQFAQLQKMRGAALEKQNTKELDRIERLEKQVVAEYQKRVEQVLISAQTQIQATPIQVKGAQAQPTKARSPQTGRTQARPTAASRTPAKKPASSKPKQPTQQRKSSGFRLFGRR